MRRAVVDKATGAVSLVDGVLDTDECNRPGTTAEGLASLKPVLRNGQRFAEGKTVTAATRQPAGGRRGPLVMMEAQEAARRGLSPLGAFEASRSPAASPTKWASARSSPSRASWSATA